MSESDPITRAEKLAKKLNIPFSAAVARVFSDAHLDNFAQQYEGEERYGDTDEARNIGWQRNIQGQGMPGEESALEDQREKRKKGG